MTDKCLNCDKIVNEDSVFCDKRCFQEYYYKRLCEDLPQFKWKLLKFWLRG